MEELRIKAGSMEFNVTGEPETVKGASKDFYDFLAAKDQRELAAKKEFAETMQEKMAWYAKKYKESHETGQPEPQPAAETGNATLRAVRTSMTSWEQIAREIKNGDGLAVGDKVDFTLKSGEQVTVVVTDDTDEYVRFESVDCIGGKDVQWNKKNTTDGGIEESNVQEWLMLELFGQLPDDLQQAISKVKRKYKDNEGNLKEYETLLFLPAASEVFDEDDCYGDEGVYEQLDYYKDRRHRMRGAAKGEDTVFWWLASVISGDSTGACIVDYYGSVNAYYGASGGDRVPLCFCIKKS